MDRLNDQGITDLATNFICTTCGTEYPDTDTPPANCPICEDDRQYVPPQGQQWTTLVVMQETYRNHLTAVEPGVTGIATEPHFAIGQQAHLIETPAGNVLWDCISYLDKETAREVRRRGGIQAIAISHAHFYTTMVEWSRAFDNAPIYLHRDNQPWVMRPDGVIQYFDRDTLEIMPGVTLIRCGGHFPGSMALHWAAGAGGKGALVTGDTLQVVSDRRYVSFMYSYPNQIPLDAAAIRRIVEAVEPYPFDVLYGGWTGRVVAPDAKEAVRRSAERYIAHLEGRSA